jgi:hypothetical protein
MMLFRIAVLALVILASACVQIPGGQAAPQSELHDLYILSVGAQLDASSRDWYAHDALYMRQSFALCESNHKSTHSKMLLGTEATPLKVRDALNWIAISACESDSLIIFFSAHGKTDDNGQYQMFLSPDEKDGTLINDGSLKDKEFVSALSGLKCPALILVDTCQSGGFESELNSSSIKGSFLFSCDVCEFSSGQMEQPSVPHGNFVIAAVEGTSELADKNQDVMVTEDEFLNYIIERVPVYDPWQHPRRLDHKGRPANILAVIDRSYTKIPLWTPYNLRCIQAISDMTPDQSSIDMLRTNGVILSSPQIGAQNNSGNSSASKALPNIEGKWASTWTASNGTITGSGEASIYRVCKGYFIEYSDPNDSYSFKVQDLTDGRLEGYYWKPCDSTSTGAWIGLIIDNEHINGKWSEGRWDFSRQTASPTPSGSK